MVLRRSGVVELPGAGSVGFTICNEPNKQRHGETDGGWKTDDEESGEVLARCSAGSYTISMARKARRPRGLHRC